MSFHRLAFFPCTTYLMHVRLKFRAFRTSDILCHVNSDYRLEKRLEIYFQNFFFYNEDGRWFRPAIPLPPFLDWIIMCYDPKEPFVLSFPFLTHFRMQLYPPPPNTTCNFHH